MCGQLQFDITLPVRYRWSGRFVGKDAGWRHMERQLVDYELIVMEKGTLYIEDEWGKYEVAQGEYLLMEPTKLQRGYQNSKCRFYWMHFFPQASAEGKRGIRLEKTGALKSAERLYVLLKQLQDTDIRYMDADYNGFLATAVLAEIENQRREKEKRDDGEELKERVDEILFGHLHERLTVGELAKRFGYHEKYFSALFKEKTGQSVKKYMDGRKMERARYLLLNSDALVSEIAEHLGYEDVQNFYHVFKGFTNCTPTEFREQYCRKKDFSV